MQVALTGRVRKIPFKEFMKAKILSEKKHATTRARKLGNVGDVFEIKKSKFVFTSVEKTRLSQVANVFFELEGFDTPEEFIAYWKDLHRKKYNPNLMVYFHEFCEL